MLPKLLLDLTHTYERAFAAYHMAEMVSAFIDGRPGHSSLGCEQGIATWDDYVIERADGTVQHHQLKRQNTPFSRLSPTRGRKRSDASQWQDLETLDKSFESLAKHFDPASSASRTPKREFFLEVVQNVDIKDGITTRDLRNLCDDCRIAVTTSAGLSQRQATDEKRDLLFNWLTTWCGFQDWEHIRLALRCLNITTEGTEADLELKTCRILERCYVDATQARLEIISFIDRNATDLGAITPHHVASNIQTRLHSHISKWIQYEQTTPADPWTINGTAGQLTTGVTTPQDVVRTMWEHESCSSILKVITSWPSNAAIGDPLPLKLARIAIHIPTLGQGHFFNVGAWKIGVEASIGGTLGLDEDGSVRFPWLEASPSAKSSNHRKLFPSTAELDAEAKVLTNEMSSTTWRLVCVEVDLILGRCEGVELRDAIRPIWDSWKNALSNDHDTRDALLAGLLHPSAEGEDIQGELRVGPQTIGLIAKGLWLSLVVAVAVNEDEGGWMKLGKNRPFRILANRRWSGPAGKRRRVQRLDSEGFSELVSAEKSEILILSGVEVSESEFSRSDLADDAEMQESLAHHRVPKQLITNSRHLNAMQKKSIREIRIYLGNKLNKISQNRELHIANASSE